MTTVAVSVNLIGTMTGIIATVTEVGATKVVTDAIQVVDVAIIGSLRGVNAGAALVAVHVPAHVALALPTVVVAPTAAPGAGAAEDVEEMIRLRVRLVGQSMRRTKKPSSLPISASERTVCMSATYHTTSSIAT
jgi:hypothetical protein